MTAGLIIFGVVIAALVIFGKDDVAADVTDSLWKIVVAVLAFIGVNIGLFYALIIKLIEC